MKTPRTCLIYLPHPWLIEPEAQAPLGLLYLGAVLEKNNYPVEIKNYTVFTDNEAIADLPEADYYGITVTSLELLGANRFAKKIKEKYPKAVVGLGGPGVYTPEFIDQDVIDTICVGDGERNLLRQLKDLEECQLADAYHGGAVPDLNTLPFPARHLLKTSQGGNVFAYKHNYLEGGSAVVITSRGCPFKCAHCASPGLNPTGSVRYRTADNICAEIKQIQDDFGIHQIRFSDDAFTANKKRVLEICEKIGPMGVAWRISIRVNPIDEEIIKALTEAGCKEVSLGIESFDDNVLKLLGKKATVADNVRALELFAKHGIKTRVLLMIRTPGQTPGTIILNKYWLERVPYNIVACTTFIPVPGSEIYNNPDAFNIEILSRNLDDYNFYFFGSDGENPLKDIIRLKDRDIDEVNAETLEFREYLKASGKLNLG